VRGHFIIQPPDAQAVHPVLDHSLAPHQNPDPICLIKNEAAHLLAVDAGDEERGARLKLGPLN
jgi:hypothetical protein